MSNTSGWDDAPETQSRSASGTSQNPNSSTIHPSDSISMRDDRPSEAGSASFRYPDHSRQGPDGYGQSRNYNDGPRYPQGGEDRSYGRPREASGWEGIRNERRPSNFGNNGDNYQQEASPHGQGAWPERPDRSFQAPPPRDYGGSRSHVGYNGGNSHDRGYDSSARLNSYNSDGGFRGGDDRRQGDFGGFGQGRPPVMSASDVNAIPVANDRWRAASMARPQNRAPSVVNRTRDTMGVYRGDDFTPSQSSQNGFDYEKEVQKSEEKPAEIDWGIAPIRSEEPSPPLLNDSSVSGYASIPPRIPGASVPLSVFTPPEDDAPSDNQGADSGWPAPKVYDNFEAPVENYLPEPQASQAPSRPNGSTAGWNASHQQSQESRPLMQHRESPRPLHNYQREQPSYKDNQQTYSSSNNQSSGEGWPEPKKDLGAFAKPIEDVLPASAASQSKPSAVNHSAWTTIADKPHQQEESGLLPQGVEGVGMPQVPGVRPSREYGGKRVETGAITPPTDKDVDMAASAQNTEDNGSAPQNAYNLKDSPSQQRGGRSSASTENGKDGYWRDRSNPEHPQSVVGPSPTFTDRPSPTTSTEIGAWIIKDHASLQRNEWTQSGGERQSSTENRTPQGQSSLAAGWQAAPQQASSGAGSPSNSTSGWKPRVFGSSGDSNHSRPSQDRATSRYEERPLPAPTPKRYDSPNNGAVHHLEKAAAPPSAQYRNFSNNGYGSSYNNESRPAPSAPSSLASKPVSIMGSGKYYEEAMKLREERSDHLKEIRRLQEENDNLRRNLSNQKRNTASYPTAPVPDVETQKQLQAAREEISALKDRLASLDIEREEVKRALLPVIERLGGSIGEVGPSAARVKKEETPSANDVNPSAPPPLARAESRAAENRDMPSDKSAAMQSHSDYVPTQMKEETPPRNWQPAPAKEESHAQPAPAYSEKEAPMDDFSPSFESMYHSRAEASTPKPRVSPVASTSSSVAPKSAGGWQQVDADAPVETSSSSGRSNNSRSSRYAQLEARPPSPEPPAREPLGWD